MDSPPMETGAAPGGAEANNQLVPYPDGSTETMTNPFAQNNASIPLGPEAEALLAIYMAFNWQGVPSKRYFWIEVTMKFALTFVGLIYLLFSLGRFLWPDRNKTLAEKNQSELQDFRASAAERSLKGAVFKLFYPVVIAYFFPFLWPGFGFIAAVGLIVLGLSL